MKKCVSLLFLLLVCRIALSVPAYRAWMTGIMADGSTVEVMQVGDEWYHYYVDAFGYTYTLESASGFLVPRQPEAAAHSRQLGAVRRHAAHVRRRLHARPQLSSVESRRGLMILVSFSDADFKSPATAQNDWQRIANEPGYAEGSARGSVRDYFLSQSDGKFDLTFDVVGPIRLPHNYAYYGHNDAENDDENVGELVHDACLAVADAVNFADYDWNADGEVDNVYFVYAGKGENDSSNPDLIWPHQWYLSEWPGYEKLEVGGVLIDTYACSSELMHNGSLSGIGTICHEFSHALGLPDMYNTETGNSVLGAWDLMDSGCYNGGRWCPVNFSAFERYACGWLSLTELSAPATITGMVALGNGGAAYKVVNDCDDPDVDEYYVLENRQQTGWDAFLPGSGLLVTHIDYDAEAWMENTPNNVVGHLRIGYIPTSQLMTGSTVAWPGLDKDSLTDSSVPAAAVFHPNRQGRLYMGKPITNIRNEGGFVSFAFMGGSALDGMTLPLQSAPAPATSAAYSLWGRPVSSTPQKGIVVRQGKKYVKK